MVLTLLVPHDNSRNWLNFLISSCKELFSNFAHNKKSCGTLFPNMSLILAGKTQLKHVIVDVKLNFDEFTTVHGQMEACHNSRLLVPLPCEDAGFKVLTPGHFHIGQPLESHPDPSYSNH